MSFKFLGVAPPAFVKADERKGSRARYPLSNNKWRKAREEHFRGALLEAAEHIETLSIWSKYISKAKSRNQLSEYLRVSAGLK